MERRMRWTAWASRSIATIVGVFSCADAFAIGQYAFVKIADTSTAAPSGTFTSFAEDPSINVGRVGFIGRYPGGRGVFTGGSGQITTVAETGDPAPSGMFSDFGKPGNIYDTAAFSATYTDSAGVFIGNGGPLTKIVQTGDPAPSGTFTGFGNAASATSSFSFGPADNRATAFHGSYPGGSGVFLGNGGPLTTIAKTGDTTPSGSFIYFGDPALSAAHGPSGIPEPIVAFRGSYAGGSGIFTGRGGSLTTIATTASLGAVTLGDPSLRGEFIAFHAILLSGLEVIALGDQNGAGPVIRTGAATPFGAFTSLGDPVVLGPTYPNFVGATLIFEATLNLTESGIFARTGGLGHISRIIKTGDALFGSTVVSVGMGRFGAEHSFYGLEASGVGNIAITYTLANGSQGIAAIYALPEPATSLPWCLAAALSSTVVMSRGRRKTASPNRRTSH
jgi:hypothetical protein